MNWQYLSYLYGPSCPAYGGGGRIELAKIRNMQCGDTCNQLEYKASNHIGTHFDFPLHFDPDGASADSYEADSFVFENPAVAWLHMEHGQLVSIDDLSKSLTQVPVANSVDFLCIRTGAGLYRDSPDYWAKGPGIDLGVADWLRLRLPQIRAIALDTISISSYESRLVGRQVHGEFLRNQHPILIIEDANLEALNNVVPKEIVALPLRIEHGDGAPCTIIARF